MNNYFRDIKGTHGIYLYQKYVELRNILTYYYSIQSSLGYKILSTFLNIKGNAHIG